VGFGSLTCSNSDNSGLAQATSPTYGVQAGNAYTYSRLDGFTRARIHFEQGSGILRLSVAPPTGGFPNPLAIATINSSWTNATERCPDDTRVAGVYGRYIDNGYIFTLGLTCRKGEATGMAGGCWDCWSGVLGLWQGTGAPHGVQPSGHSFLWLRFHTSVHGANFVAVSCYGGRPDMHVPQQALQHHILCDAHPVAIQAELVYVAVVCCSSVSDASLIAS
jgi:hypothetical protein